MTNSPSNIILGLDLGTTGNRAILFNQEGQIMTQFYQELSQFYPEPGWVEHDPVAIWEDTAHCIHQVLQNLEISGVEIAAIGLTVQRETCLLWDKTTGEPLHPAIVWLDRRTASLCRELTEKGHAAEIQNRTGLVLDAYFSATKLAWLLQWVQDNRPDINPQNILAGTIDTWILWKLTGSKVHATDRSNASRTLLMNLNTLNWDPTLLNLFGIPQEIMPEIRDSFGYFGETDPDILGFSVPIMAILGDQQAALFAHGCDRPGLVKCTYGTGCFLIAQTGQELVRSHHQLLSTVAWTDGNQVNYALEGAMFTTGRSVQWLRDGLNLIHSAGETEAIARSVPDTNGAYFVPALSGLGAPHWDMSARGAFLGLTAGVTRAHLVRAVLEAIAYQVKEVVDAINQDSDIPVQRLKVDGGACENDFLMQFQADVLNIPLERPTVLDATAQGAAFAAGLAVGLWTDYRTLVQTRTLDRCFEPGEGKVTTAIHFAQWQKAVSRAKNWVD
ncbi:MAG TPA: glycerol kinase GlpK [Vampirovibrionales bacterium]